MQPISHEKIAGEKVFKYLKYISRKNKIARKQVAEFFCGGSVARHIMHGDLFDDGGGSGNVKVIAHPVILGAVAKLRFSDTPCDFDRRHWQWRFTSVAISMWEEYIMAEKAKFAENFRQCAQFFMLVFLHNNQQNIENEEKR